MKKGTKLFTVAASIGLSLTALVGTAALSKTLLAKAFNHPINMSCDYYWNSENGFTSIAEINTDLFYNGKQSLYKSWGTITEQWEYGGKTNTFVQSTDKYGNSAAICLYGCNTPASTYPVGSVIEFEFSGSALSNYNNLPEITSLASVSLAYDSNPSPVQSLNAEVIWSDGYNSSSSYFETVKALGPIRVRLENITLSSYASNGQSCTVTTQNGYEVPLYYANVGPNAETSSYIDSNIYNVSNGSTFSLYGYLNPFQKNSNSSLQFLVKNVFDIVPASFTRDSDVVQSVSLPANAKTVYEINDSFDINSLVLNMRDGSTKDTYYTEIVGYDMSNDGDYQLTANCYYYGGTNNKIHAFTARNFASITVRDGGTTVKIPTYLEVLSYFLKTEYNVGDSFEIPPYVFVEYDDDSSENVAYDCTYSGYDLNNPGTYTVLVSYSYNGVTVTTSYTITVSEGSGVKTPSYISLIHATTEYNVGDDFINPTVYLYYTDGSYKDVSAYVLCDGFDMSTPGTYTVEVSYFEESFVDSLTYTITVSGTSPVNDTITFNSAITDGTYSTGNYGTKYVNGYDFTYYRTTTYSGYVANLLPATCDYGDPMGGSIANIDPIQGIDTITIKYSNTSKSGATAAKLSYGESNTLDGSFTIPYSTSENTVTFNISDGANFIKIEAGNTKLALKEFSVHYTNDGSSYYSAISAYTNNYRVNPNKYTGTLVAGSTSVTVPISVSYSGSSYTVLQSKTYTYYTLDYVESHPSVIDDAAMLDPVDVANYFSIFGTVPANYGGSTSSTGIDNTVNDVKNVFGSSTRMVQWFNRTNGYATAIPNVKASSGYYEFDIDIDGSYYPGSGGRGVGRVVAWIYGINNSAYGNGSYAVCDFTDDHYATFQEFNNLGEFLPKFDAEQKITGKKWSAPNTAHAA